MFQRQILLTFLLPYTNLLDYFLFITIDLVQSATLFREAAGLYRHLADESFASLQQHSLLVEKPPEILPSVSTVMNLICLAEAQVSTLVLFYSSPSFASITGSLREKCFAPLV